VLVARLALLFALALFAGCTSAPPPPPPPPPPTPDTDGKPEESTNLEIGMRHRDQLDCAVGDCADWFRVHVPQRGRLRVDAYLQAGDEGSPYEVELRKGNNEPLATAKKIGPGQRGLEIRVEIGDYLIGVQTGKEIPAIHYEIAAYFQRFVALPSPLPPPVEPKPAPEPARPPPPPAPRYRVVEAEVLEVEGGASRPDAVLISAGREAGIQPGLRGRLLAHGSSIAAIQVVDVYPDGSRARIDGAPRSPITVDTKVEIDVPIDSPGGAATGDSDASPSRSF
jgi:hypothetical protein